MQTVQAGWPTRHPVPQHACLTSPKQTNNFYVTVRNNHNTKASYPSIKNPIILSIAFKKFNDNLFYVKIYKKLVHFQ